MPQAVQIELEYPSTLLPIPFVTQLHSLENV